MQGIDLTPPILFSLGEFPVTNTLLFAVIVSCTLIGLALYVRRNLRDVPRGVQFWAEVLFETVLDFLYQNTPSKKAAHAFFALVMTIFVFILFGNLFAYLPGLSAITYAGIPIYRTITSDYSLVLMLTLLSYVVMQVTLIATGGFMSLVRKYLNFTGPWRDKPINAFLGIMDFVGDTAKIASLSFRLFGNMFAGEVLGTVIGGLVPFLAPLPFALLGLLTTFVQPAVFAIFTTLNAAGNIVPAPQKS